MNEITKTCKISGQEFTVREKDQQFYQMMGVNPPTLCPDERLRRRLSWRNEINLYKRKCDFTGSEIISIYSQDKPYKIYDHTVWYSEKWDALSYGRDFNFNRTFFEQFEELWEDVPKLNLTILGDNENSDYTNDNYRLKNCYLVFDGEQARDCLYGETFILLKDCLDFWYLINSELCYECIYCSDCYDLSFSSYCHNCQNSAFLMDCTGCKNCFGCANLKQKEYYIGNKPYSKEEYEKIIGSYNLGSYEQLEKFKTDSEKFFSTQPKRAMRGLMNENVTGDNLNNCKDTFDSYDCRDTRDCRFCTNVQLSAQDCYDIDIWGDNLKRAVDCECAGAGAENIIASYYAGLGGSNIFHSAFCYKNTHNVLGCTGLIQKQYCILNKQYTKEDYEKLHDRIIEHIKRTGEFGEFFPTSMSAFGYNETVANDYFPMNKEDALSRGYKWKDPDPKDYRAQNYAIPDNINDVPDSILNEILACVNCGRNYKIQYAELRFYRRKGLAIPRKCFNCRHKDRMKLRNSRKLWDRKCDGCDTVIQTPYGESERESLAQRVVLCEKCYLEIKV